MKISSSFYRKVRSDGYTYLFDVELGLAHFANPASEDLIVIHLWKVKAFIGTVFARPSLTEMACLYFHLFGYTNGTPCYISSTTVAIW